MPVRYGWEYYAESVAGMEEVDRNWDILNPDVGVISLPRDELDKWGVQILGDDPSDPDKALVWIRASHSLHCLVRTPSQGHYAYDILIPVSSRNLSGRPCCRYVFYSIPLVPYTTGQLILAQLVKGENLTMTFGHSMHCMGALLRDIVCYADSSLPLKGENDKAEYQYVRKCRNWAAMSEWAGQRTTCITTGIDGILDAESQDFENCARSDGVLLSAMSLPKQSEEK